MHWTSYRAIPTLPLAKRVATMRDPAFKVRLLAKKAAANTLLFRTITSRFDRMFHLGDPPDYEPSPGRSMAALAQGMGCNSAELAYDLMVQNDGGDPLFMPSINFVDGDHAITLQMLQHPNAILGWIFPVRPNASCSVRMATLQPLFLEHPFSKMARPQVACRAN